MLSHVHVASAEQPNHVTSNTRRHLMNN